MPSLHLPTSPSPAAFASFQPPLRRPVEWGAGRPLAFHGPSSLDTGESAVNPMPASWSTVMPVRPCSGFRRCKTCGFRPMGRHGVISGAACQWELPPSHHIKSSPIASHANPKGFAVDQRSTAARSADLGFWCPTKVVYNYRLVEITWEKNTEDLILSPFPDCLPLSNPPRRHQDVKDKIRPSTPAP